MRGDECEVRKIGSSGRGTVGIACIDNGDLDTLIPKVLHRF